MVDRTKIELTFEYQPGRRTELDEENIERICIALKQVYVMNQVAAMCFIPQQTLHDWLKRGKEDNLLGKETIYRQLAVNYQSTRSAMLREHLERLQTLPKNYQPLVWILEKCFRDDFGADSEETKQLRALFKVILPLLGKGDLLNGKTDSEETQSDS